MCTTMRKICKISSITLVQFLRKVEKLWKTHNLCIIRLNYAKKYVCQWLHLVLDHWVLLWGRSVENFRQFLLVVFFLKAEKAVKKQKLFIIMLIYAKLCTSLTQSCLDHSALARGRLEFHPSLICNFERKEEQMDGHKEGRTNEAK